MKQPSIGARVARLREAKKLTREQLADASGVHFNTVRNVEMGVGTMNLATLDAIAEALGVETTKLLAGRRRPKIGNTRKAAGA